MMTRDQKFNRSYMAAIRAEDRRDARIIAARHADPIDQAPQCRNCGKHFNQPERTPITLIDGICVPCRAEGAK